MILLMIMMILHGNDEDYIYILFDECIHCGSVVAGA